MIKKFGYYCSVADSLIMGTTTLAEMGCDSAFNSIFHRIVDQPIDIFRCAYILFDYAEAIRSGQLDASCHEAVNNIRQAYKLEINTPLQYDLQPGLSAAQFCDSVIAEGKLKLCAEPEGHWFDMLRLRLATNLAQIKLHQGILVYPTAIDISTFLLPIPEVNKVLDPNLK